jgi:hypothetical protein
MKRGPSRAAWAAFAAVVAIGLAAWATWTLAVRRDAAVVTEPTSRPDDAPSNGAAPPASPTPSHATAKADDAPPPAETATGEEPWDAAPLLGDSLDPERLQKARSAFDEALRQLEDLDEPTPQRVSEIFLKGKAAIERMEDEARGDPEAEAAVGRDLARLRAAAQRASTSKN